MSATVTNPGSERSRWRRRRKGPSAAPMARRHTTARMGDVRLWFGIALVGASMLAGAKVVAAGDDTVTLWRASRDLSVGATATGLEPVTVSRSAVTSRYLAGDEGMAQSAGLILGRPVAAGELVPRSALVAPGVAATRRVTVAVDPLHAPVDLQPGDVVDVWSTPRAPSDAVVVEPDRVLAGAMVAGTMADGMGVGGEVGIVLDVPESRVGDLVEATRTGVIDLVAVPLASQVSGQVAGSVAAPATGEGSIAAEEPILGGGGAS